MKEIYQKYKHGLVIGIFSLFYLFAFRYLEARPIHGYHVVHTVFDDFIPFCEYFIIPYALWFPYMFGTFFYFIFFNKNKKEYYQFTFNMILGMSVFLVVSYFYPNIQYLRPTTFANNNIFTQAVRFLYKVDTPTNILPSIHVYNSLAIHMAINSCEALRDKKWVRRGSLVLCILIVLSTMFLRQHTVVDVVMGITLAMFGTVIFYPEQTQIMVEDNAWTVKRQHN
ncbi:MAG: phosphatase PAP2 family protein [Clostridiales bacterium]|nr:phosphatase PAP2 family protein [Candidatus Blautia equi]